MTESDNIATIRDGMLVPNLFTVAEVSEALDISKNTLYKEIQAGRLRVRRPIGRRTGYRISLEDINDWALRTTEVINKTQ